MRLCKIVSCGLIDWKGKRERGWQFGERLLLRDCEYRDCFRNKTLVKMLVLRSSSSKRCERYFTEYEYIFVSMFVSIFHICCDKKCNYYKLHGMENLEKEK